MVIVFSAVRLPGEVLFPPCINDEALNTNLTVIACQSFTLGVTLCPNDSSPAPSFQWYYVPPDGQTPIAITGATQATITLAEPGIQSTGEYFCRVENPAATVTSRRASVQVVPNTNAPSILYAYTSFDNRNEFTVVFDQPIRMAGGDDDPGSWKVLWPPGPSGDLDVVSARLTDGNIVVLTTASPRTGSLYVCRTVRDIMQRCGNLTLAAGAYVASRPQEALVGFNDGVLWRYHDDAIDPGQDWMQPGFNDGLWGAGVPIFDRDSTDPGRNQVFGLQVGTTLSLTSLASVPPPPISTFLFRRHVYVPSGSVQFQAQAIHDDGFILYVNGREVFRRGVPEGTENFWAFAPYIPPPGNFVTQFTIPASNFVAWDNVVAVLLKQASPTSGDATFGLQLTAVVPQHVAAPSVGVSKQPPSVDAAEGHRWSTRVEATGSGYPLSYQWFRNGTPLPGATEASVGGLASLDHSGTYRVLISNGPTLSWSSNAVVQIEPVPFRYDSPWRYQTNQQDWTLFSTPWYEPGFDDSDWPLALAPFGAETTEATLARLPFPILSPLPLPDASFRTVYFRTRVVIPSVSPPYFLALCHTIDDGAAFYVDGVEAHRYNLPSSSPIYSTNTAVTAVPGDGDTQIVCLRFPLAAGEHVLAVEVHQDSSSAADILFGLELRKVRSAELVITPGPDGYRVEWDAGPFWRLVQSPSPAGPFGAGSSTASSPFSIPKTPVNRFYRLRFDGQ